MTNNDEIQTTAHALQPLAVAPGEAARLMGIGRTLVYEEIASTRLRSAKIGKRRLITIEAIRDWLAAREADSTPSTTGDADEC